MFTAALKQQDVVPNLAGNGFVVIGQSTSRMRVSEFAELLESLYRHSVQSVALSGRTKRDWLWNGKRDGEIGLHDYQIKYASTRQGLLANATLAFDALDIEFGFWLDSAASDKMLCALTG